MLIDNDSSRIVKYRMMAWIPAPNRSAKFEMFSLGTPLISRNDSHTSCSPACVSTSTSSRKASAAVVAVPFSDDPIRDDPFRDIDVTVACRIRQMHLSRK